MKSIVIISVMAAISIMAGCTDVARSRIGSFGDPAHIRCYSGGMLFYEGNSTGKVSATKGSDGWEFKDAETGKFVRVSGSCLVEN